MSNPHNLPPARIRNEGRETIYETDVLPDSNGRPLYDDLIVVRQGSAEVWKDGNRSDPITDPATLERINREIANVRPNGVSPAEKVRMDALLDELAAANTPRTPGYNQR